MVQVYVVVKEGPSLTLSSDPANKTNLEIVRAPNGDKVPQKVETTNPAAIDLNRPHPSKSHPTWVLGMFSRCYSLEVEV